MAVCQCCPSQTKEILNIILYFPLSWHFSMKESYIKFNEFLFFSDNKNTLIALPVRAGGNLSRQTVFQGGAGIIPHSLHEYLSDRCPEVNGK